MQWKSRGERRIGQWLEQIGLPHHYEHPYAVVDRGKVRVWYPDFYLPEMGVIVEYAGMNGSNSYQACLDHKKARFNEMGVPALFLDEADLRGNWTARLLEWFVRVEEQRQAKTRAIQQGNATQGLLPSGRAG